MTYTRQSWVDGSTVVDAAHMVHIEDGIVAAQPGISYGTTPPASPADGDLWCFPADTTNGVMWLFRYRAASASSYKWEFVGGTELSNYFAGSDTTTATGLTEPTNQQRLTCPRAGDYTVGVNSVVSNNNSVPTGCYCCVTPLRTNAHMFVTPVASGTGNQYSYSARGKLAAAQVADVLALTVAVGTGTMTIQQRYLTLIPIRVS